MPSEKLFVVGLGMGHSVISIPEEALKFSKKQEEWKAFGLKAIKTLSEEVKIPKETPLK